VEIGADWTAGAFDILGFDGQQREVWLEVQGFGSFDRDGQLTQYTLNVQAFRTHGFSVRLVRDECHIFSRARQQAADQAADSASSNHNDFGFGPESHESGVVRKHAMLNLA